MQRGDYSLYINAAGLTILLILMNAGLIHFVLMGIFIVLFELSLNRIFSARFIRPIFKIDLKLWRYLVKEGWPLGLTYFFVMIYSFFGLSFCEKKPNTPEQEKFRETTWAKFIESKGIDFKRMNTDDKYWEKVKDKYFKLIRSDWDKIFDKFNEKIYGVLTPKNYVQSPGIKKIIDNYQKYIDRNIKYGRKEQYATYIPHIHTLIKKPLIPEEVRKIL